MKKHWNDLKAGKEILLSGTEIDKLQDFVDTLPTEEQHLYYHHFSSLNSNEATGFLARCYICKLKNIVA